MRALVVPVTASVAVHVALVLAAAHAPAKAAHKRAPLPLKMREVKHEPKPPLPPPPPVRRIARATPKRVVAAALPLPAPPRPQGFSVDTKSTVAESHVEVKAKEGGGNLFADPDRALPAGDKATAPAPPPAPEPLQPAEWLTDEADRSPPYPGAALRNEIEGQVLLRVCIGPSGAVDTVQLVKGLGFGCDEAATKWAKERWRFRPARRGGKPVATCLMQPVRFQLSR